LSALERRIAVTAPRLDLSYAVICCFERPGWATAVPRMPARAIEARRTAGA
jgi:hypothetical protein